MSNGYKNLCANPPKRIFHDPQSGRSARVCKHCGAHIYGHNRGICNKCLKEREVKHV